MPPPPVEAVLPVTAQRATARAFASLPAQRRVPGPPSSAVLLTTIALAGTDSAGLRPAGRPPDQGPARRYAPHAAAASSSSAKAAARARVRPRTRAAGGR